MVRTADPTWLGRGDELGPLAVGVVVEGGEGRALAVLGEPVIRVIAPNPWLMGALGAVADPIVLVAFQREFGD